jgi:hypothetical protein
MPFLPLQFHPCQNRTPTEHQGARLLVPVEEIVK